MQKDKSVLTSQKSNFSKWYLEVLKKTALIDYAPVKGCIVFKPYAYELWENIQKILDKKFKDTGHKNVYFPTLIPKSLLEKEKEHVEGFNPELPWVTEVADEKLEEKLALRPTSETIIGYLYSKWIKSYRDLPLLLNQWCNVFRWEKRTLPFLRTTEFLWQEGHTAHATSEEALKETMLMLDIYEEVLEKELAIPVYKGKKTSSEKFAGAIATYSVEAMMKDGKAVQAGTSHYLGQNFSKSFDIKFTDKENVLNFVYTTSWGVSTRLLGAIIMVHGDDKGLVLPPNIAPIQVVIVPIFLHKDKEDVLKKVESLLQLLKAQNIRVEVDLSDKTPGFKFNFWELKGVPLRIELGSKDISKNTVTVFRRDKMEKAVVSFDAIVKVSKENLEDIQKNMYKNASVFRATYSYLHLNTLEELKDHVKKSKEEGSLAGFVLGGFCGDVKCEKLVKEETGFTSRNIPFAPPCKKERCIACKNKAIHSVWFARAY